MIKKEGAPIFFFSCQQAVIFQLVKGLEAFLEQKVGKESCSADMGKAVQQIFICRFESTGRPTRETDPKKAKSLLAKGDLTFISRGAKPG